MSSSTTNIESVLHESAPRWPYAGTWAARGEHAVTTAPALSVNGVLAFGTTNAVYAVRKADGRGVAAFPRCAFG